VAVDIFQEVLTKLFAGLDFVPAYLDGILIHYNAGSLEDHMYKAGLVMECLQQQLLLRQCMQICICCTIIRVPWVLVK
jgi:hypothetical protein